MFFSIFLRKNKPRTEELSSVTIEKGLLTVRFTKNGNDYVYYGERSTKHLNTVIRSPGGDEINFYPGFIPKLKAKSLGFDHFIFEGEDGEEKIVSTEKIFII